MSLGKCVIILLVAFSISTPGNVRAFPCGDADGNSVIDFSDFTYLADYIFNGGSVPTFPEGNADGCGSIDIGDMVYLSRYIFHGAPDPFNCGNSALCAQFSQNVAITLGCRPYNVYPGGDSIAIPIYLTAEVPIYGFTLGFVYGTPFLEEITSISISGSLLSGESSSLFSKFDTDQNLAFVGWTYIGNPIPVTVNGLLFTLNFKLNGGDPNQCVIIDSLFVAPAGTFVVINATNQQRTPAFTNCFCSTVSGDADGSGIVDISDAVFLIQFIFQGGPAPSPEWLGDADCSEIVDISDAVFLIQYIFQGGPAPCTKMSGVSDLRRRVNGLKF